MNYIKIYQNKIQDIVFHCALSQVRGPSSTLKFLRGIDDITDSKVKSYFNDDNIQVYVLHGASKWQEEYGNDREVTEAYDQEIWEFGS